MTSKTRRDVSIRYAPAGLPLVANKVELANAQASLRTPHRFHLFLFGVRQLAAAFAQTATSRAGSSASRSMGSQTLCRYRVAANSPFGQQNLNRLLRLALAAPSRAGGYAPEKLSDVRFLVHPRYT